MSDQVPGMTNAKCHACGLDGAFCLDPECPNPRRSTKVFTMSPVPKDEEELYQRLHAKRIAKALGDQRQGVTSHSYVVGSPWDPATPPAPAPEGEYEGLCKRLEGWVRAWAIHSDERGLACYAMGKAATALRTVLRERDEAVAKRTYWHKGYLDEMARAVEAETRLAEATKALRKAVRGQQRLWDLAQGFDPDDPDDGPRCRDCADEDGTCPFSGYSCDPQQAAEQRMRILLSRMEDSKCD